MSAPSDGEAPPRRTRSLREVYGPTLTKVVLGTIVGVVALFGTAFLLTPRLNSRPQKKTTCANHLRQIGGILAFETLEHGYPTEGGAPLLIRYRQRHLVPTNREAILTCPHDPDAREPVDDEASAAYDAVDPNDADAIASMCSYAVRDFARFPVDENGKDPETGDVAWIACDRQGTDGRTPHHKGGLNVLFDDGSVRFLDRKYLGVGPDDPIIVGPDSTHPELRKMVFVPARPTEGQR